MIITRPKNPADILESLARHRQVSLLGCGLCATSCNTGGRREVASMASFLSREGKEILWTEVVDGICQRPLTEKALSRMPKPEAILVMACGSGVQTVADVAAVPVHPALDSLFLGSVVRAGRFEEKCSLCGSCLLDDFGGLCPLTLCPKKLLNGPCGGMEDGRCEADREKECVWHRIFLVKLASGRLSDLEKIAPPRSHRRSGPVTP